MPSILVGMLEMTRLVGMNSMYCLASPLLGVTQRLSKMFVVRGTKCFGFAPTNFYMYFLSRNYGKSVNFHISSETRLKVHVWT